MTVKELKEYLSDKDDDQEIRVYNPFRQYWELLSDFRIMAV